MRIIIVLIGLLALTVAGCGSNEPEIDPYEFTTAQVAFIEAGVSNSLLQEEYRALREDEWLTMCENYKHAGWDYNRLVEQSNAIGQPEWIKSAQKHFLTWLFVVAGDERVDASPSLASGFCAHKLDD